MFKLKKLIISLLMTLIFVSLFASTAEAKGSSKPGPSNNPPVINAGAISATLLTDEDVSQATFTLTAKDPDRNDSLTWTISNVPSNGTAAVKRAVKITGGSQATIIYTPDANYNGNDSFVVQVKDTKGGSDSITVSVTINPVNDKPQNIVPPSISGIIAVGETLTADKGTWSDDKDTAETLQYAYQWQQTTDINSTFITDLTGAANSTYLLTDSDYGKYLRIAVTATDTGEGTSQIQSNIAYSGWLYIETTPSAISYVALGDSIATGTIYPGTSITTYVTYFYQHLQQDNPGSTVTMQNLAADGARSNELFTKLGLDANLPADPNIVNAIAGADIITISIGGNNLMQAAKDSSALGGYNFNQINTSVANQGLLDFNTQWVPIVNRIKELNPGVRIIVNTLYNPYNESDSLHSTVDSYLFLTDPAAAGINDVILSNSTLGYQVADVYGAFNQYSANMDAITYFYPGPFDLWGQLTRNPHPNAAGQSIITNLVIGSYDLMN